MKISEAIQVLESAAPLHYQESYDNAGLLTGHADMECSGVLCTLDATEAVILEAKEKGCNLVVAHHPIIFSGLKKINGKNYVERAVIAAIRNDIAIYAAHTNLDNVLNGVNDRMADRLGLISRRILVPKAGQWMKLFTFVPDGHIIAVRSALFEAGAGHIGQYSNTSFSHSGTGTFKGGEGTHPFAGRPGLFHEEKETKLEVIFPACLQEQVIRALLEVHPYEEAAYDVMALANDFGQAGSGLIGELPGPLDETAFLELVKSAFRLTVIRHTPLLNKKVKKVALCGGSGSFLIGKAISGGADAYISADIKYHEFFDANDRLVVADIGHWESEQYTVDLLIDILQAKFPTFAVLKSGVKTNPVNYFL